MTSPRLRVFNPAGGLVLGESAFGLNYVGKATRGSLVGPTGTVNSTDREAGYSTYQITSVNEPVPFISLQHGKKVALRSKTNLGSNVWQFEVICESGGDADGIGTPDWTDVYCFAAPTVYTGPGLRISDDSGNLRWAVGPNNGRLLYLKGFFHIPGNTAYLDGSPQSIPNLNTPAVFGFPSSQKRIVTQDGPSVWEWRHFSYGWLWDALLDQVTQTNYLRLLERQDAPFSDLTSALPANAFIIDATGLS